VNKNKQKHSGNENHVNHMKEEVSKPSDHKIHVELSSSKTPRAVPRGQEEQPPFFELGLEYLKGNEENVENEDGNQSPSKKKLGRPKSVMFADQVLVVKEMKEMKEEEKKEEVKKKEKSRIFR